MKPIGLILFLSLVPAVGIAAPIEKGVSVCIEGDCSASEPKSVQPKPKSRTAQDAEPISSPKEHLAQSKPRRSKPKKPAPQKPHPAAAHTQPEEPQATNLPEYYSGIKRASNDHAAMILEIKPKGDTLTDFSVGDIFQAVIEQELEVSSQLKQPIRAFLISGPHPGAMIVGDASLENELHRVLITFTTLRIGGITYLFKGSALSKTGTIGLHGEYHTDTGKFFLAEMLSSFSSAILDSTVQRSQTAFGNYATAPTLENSSKIAAAQSAAKTSQKFADEMKNAPRYTSVGPYQEIQVIIEAPAKKVEAP